MSKSSVTFRDWVQVFETSKEFWVNPEFFDTGEKEVSRKLGERLKIKDQASVESRKVFGTGESRSQEKFSP